MTMVDVKRSLPVIIENYKKNELNELSFKSGVHQNFHPNIYEEDDDNTYPQWYSDEYEINLNKALEYTSEGASIDDSLHYDSEETRSDALSFDSCQLSSPEPIVQEQDSVDNRDSIEDNRSDTQKYRASLWKTSLEHCSRIVMSSRRKSLEGNLLTDLQTSNIDNRSGMQGRRNSVGYFLNRSDNSPSALAHVQSNLLNKSLGALSDFKAFLNVGIGNPPKSGPRFDTSLSESIHDSLCEETNKDAAIDDALNRSADLSKCEIPDSVFPISNSPMNRLTDGESSCVNQFRKTLEAPVKMRGERLSSGEMRKLSISDDYFVEKMLFGLNISTRGNFQGRSILNRSDSEKVMSPYSSKYSTPRRSRSLTSVAESENDDSLNNSCSESLTESLKFPQWHATDSLSQSCKLLTREFSPHRTPNCSTPLSESPSTSVLCASNGTQESQRVCSNGPGVIENETEENPEAESQTDLELLQEAANRLHLSVRRPSILAWRQKFVDNNSPVADTGSVVNVLEKTGKQNSLETRRAQIDENLNWIRQELGNMKHIDESLASQFLSIREDIFRLKLKWSCEEHEELLEDVIDEMKEREELSEYVDAPVDLIECNPLKHLGVTRMNITNRRFSMC